MAKAGRPKKIQPTANLIPSIATTATAITETKVSVKDGFYTQVSPHLFYYNLGRGILLKYQYKNLHAVVYIPDDIIPEDNFKIVGRHTSVLNVPSGSVILETSLDAITLTHVAQLI